MVPRLSPCRFVLTFSQSNLLEGIPAERRALFGLAAVAVSQRVPASLVPALAESDPVALAAEALRMQVHTSVGAVLTRHPELAAHMPADLILFFRAMYAANRQRVSEGLAQLGEIGAALAVKNIPAVVLKGGGDMLSPFLDDPAARYVGDLDILVPTGSARDALAVMRGLGAAPASPPAHETSRFDWRGQRLPTHHLPLLVRPGWVFPVEIHVQVGAGAVAKVLSADAVLARRMATAVRGLSIAAAEDRACHLVSHAARHDGMVGLRAWIDWATLRRTCDREAVETRLRRAGYGQTFETSELMADLLDAGGAKVISLAKTAVARNAVLASGVLKASPTADLVRFLFRRCRGLVLSAAYRRHIAKRLVERGFLRNFVSLRRGRGRHR